MRSLITMMLLSMVTSCTDKDASLLGLLPVEFVVSPEVWNLFEQPDAKFTNVNLTRDHVIEGSTNYHVFSTSDNFKNVTLWNYHPIAEPSNFIVSDSTLLRVENLSLGYRVLYSKNYGKNMQIFNPVFDVTPPADLRAYAFLDDENILMTSGRITPDQQGNHYETLIYRINLKTQKGVLISTVDNYYAYSAHVANNRVWIAWSSDQNPTNFFTTGYVSHSDDGGVTWSTPVFIDYGYYLTIAAGSLNNVFAYSQDGCYVSADAGNSWTPVANVEGIIFTELKFADSKTIYALGNNELMKSDDAGVTWHKTVAYTENTAVWGIPRFIDPLHGIVFNNENIFLTENGAQSWTLVMSRNMPH